jgi:hypothetical protein
MGDKYFLATNILIYTFDSPFQYYVKATNYSFP